MDAKKPARNVVVIAASVGGIQALSTVIESLPANLPAALAIAQHLSRSQPSHLADILTRRTPLPVKQAAHGDRLCHGCVFVAPPNRHLLVRSGGVLQLSDSPPIHFSRPSAEPLFSSVAALYGRNALGVVLTGSDSDASLGVQTIKNAGGNVIVQDATTSVDFSMPQSAISTGAVDQVVPLEKITAAIVAYVQLMPKPRRRV